jgi:hypothetical protein
MEMLRFTGNEGPTFHCLLNDYLPRLSEMQEPEIFSTPW